MKTAAVYTGSATFAKTLTELLPEYNTTYESVSAGFSGADMNVLDLYDTVSFSSAYEKLFAFFKSVMYYTKSTESGNHTSTVVIIPSGLGYKDETYLYLIKGMLKSFACELADYGSIVNCIECSDRSDEKLARLVSFFADSRAYMTAQILRPDFSRKVPNSDSNKPTVLITGAGQGIGAATAEEFSRLGYNVFVNDIALTDNVKNVITKTGGSPAIGDISDKSKTDSFIHETAEKYGRIDVFVANAAFMHMCPFEQLSCEELERHISVNIKGHLNCLEKIIEIMKKQGGGRIILFSSMFGTAGWKNAVSYAGTKTAMIGLGQYLSRELSEYGISVAVVSPGVIDTPQLRADADDLGVTIDEVKEIYKKDIPLGRLGTAADVAYLTAFLGNGGADYLSGQILQTNGGEVRTTPETI